MTHQVIRQDWLESERGWGCRPDGYSLHLSEEDRVQFIDNYWARMPNNVPDEYSRPSGEPKNITATHEQYSELLAQQMSGALSGEEGYGKRYFK